jgi:hypothetical protein
MLRRRLVSIYRRLKDRGGFFFKVSPEGTAVLRMFIIWKDYFFIDMGVRSCGSDYVTAPCVQDVQPKILFCSETLVLFSLKS